jgi:uncharacterized protein YegJ (DUF2314 family)
MVKPLQVNILLLLCLLLTVSCAPAAPTPLPPVTVDEMDAAIQQAHETLSTVRQALLAPKASYDWVGLKVRFVGAGESEEIWTQPVDYYNGSFTVQMEEGVTLQLGLHPDRFVLVPNERVLDWVIVKKDGRIIGGYTIRLAYEHMTPEEKEQFIKISGYVME